jgi:hypothetical protein
MTEITFADYARPALDNGRYTITVSQQAELDTRPYTATRTFTVSGDRFTLPPARLAGLFPPDGSLGEYQNALPHVLLDRPTLPWERFPGQSKTDVAGPWLVILLFTDDQAPPPLVVDLGDLSAGPGYFPPVSLEDHQSPDYHATVIDVPRDLLAELVPTPAELPYLAHLRRIAGAPDAAVVLGSRLPPAGARCTAHLVSVEGRYLASGFDLGEGSLVRLVTLASWRFASLDADQTFAPLVRDLASDAGPYRLPDSGDPDADHYLRQGYVPMPHRLRQGGTTISWYRGPLADGPVSVPSRGDTLTADHLLAFQPETGMFDAGYAAAWELGRLLALRSTDFATTLFDWKRRRAQSHLRAALGTATGFPLAVPDIDVTVPDTVTRWLAELAFLAGVPPMYLIPDARLLPVETIRFAQVDVNWIRNLLDGAFSIGRLSSADAELDGQYPLDQVPVPVTTALIRSDVVSGYPGLVVDGFAAPGGGDPLPSRQVPLAPSILLCLFSGTVARLDISQRPAAQHFAVELTGEGQFTKTLRNPAGTTGPVLEPLVVGPGGRLPIVTLTTAMSEALGVAPFGPGDFARQMIETAERVTFLGRA